MPRYLKQNGNKVPNVKQELAWIEIGVRSKSTKEDAPINTETYLVQPRVADYIVRLEKLVGDNLPLLPKK